MSTSTEQSSITKINAEVSNKRKIDDVTEPLQKTSDHASSNLRTNSEHCDEVENLFVDNIQKSRPEDFLPSAARFTDRGGYAHTTKARLAISIANKGNTPWNKGKNRSGSDRAKIAAGVRARNRAVLLEKLKKLGMTEEEWTTKKNEIKRARERLRKAKKANDERDAEKEAQKGLENGAIVTGTLKIAEFQQQYMKSKPEPEILSGCLDSMETKKTYEQITLPQQSEDNLQHHISLENATSPALLDKFEPALKPAPLSKNDPESDSASSDEETNPSLDSSIFAQYFRWQSHPFDFSETSYDKSCPTGGPGGLICCDACTANYSQYLTTTYKDIEDQTITNIGAEVTQLIDFLGESKERLEKTIKVVRKLPLRKPPKQKVSKQT